MLNFSSLLLVKDFADTGNVKVDTTTFMSSLDINNIAFNGNSPLMIDSINDRKFFVSKVSWELKMEEDTVYPIQRQYEVSKNVFDLRNWKRIK